MSSAPVISVNASTQSEIRQTGVVDYSWLLLIVLLVATVCRMYALDSASLWADELWGVDACSDGSWWTMINSMITKDSHPPGYQTLLYVWMQWFGDNDAVVRFPSVLAGIAAVSALYHLGARLFTPLIGLLAATILAVSYNAIYYSQEARAYIFLMLFAIWHFDLFFRLFYNNEKTTWNWVRFWIVGLLLCYFHYVGMVVVFSELLAMLLLPAFRQAPAILFKAFRPIAIGYLPWALVMLQHLLHPDQSWETATPGWSALVSTARFIWGPGNATFIPAFGCFVGFLGYVWYHIKTVQLPELDRRLLLLLILAAIPWLLFFVKSHVGASAYTFRHFIFLIPVAALITARVIAGFLLWLKPDLGIGWLLSLLLVMVWSVSAVNVSDSFAAGGKLYSGITKQEYREAAKLISTDADFIAHEKKNVFVSNKFFDHYLRKFRVRYKPAFFMHENSVDRMPEYERIIKEQGMKNFYYMEIFQNSDTRAPTPVLKELQKRYYTVCQTPFFWVQVVKLSTVLPPNPSEKPPACPHSVAVAIPAVEASAPPAESAPPVLPVGQ